jgi:hypothetical protein
MKRIPFVFWLAAFLLSVFLIGSHLTAQRIGMPANSSATIASGDIPTATNGRAYGSAALPVGPYIRLTSHQFDSVAEGTSETTLNDISGNGLNFTCTGLVSHLGVNTGFWMGQQAYATLAVSETSNPSATVLNYGCTNSGVSVAANNFTLALIWQRAEGDNGSGTANGGGQSSFWEMKNGSNWAPTFYLMYGSGVFSVHGYWQVPNYLPNIMNMTTTGGGSSNPIGFWRHAGPEALVIQASSTGITTTLNRGRNYTLSTTSPSSTSSTVMNLAADTTFNAASQNIYLNEMDVWKRQLTAVELGNLFRYANLAWSVPNGEVRALLAIVGDSAQSGRYAYGSQDAYNQLAEIYNAFPFLEIRNAGIGNAQTKHWMLTSETSGAITGTAAYRNATAASDPMLSLYDNTGTGSTIASKTAILSLGVNDCIASLLPADIYGALKIIGTDLKAKGFYVVLDTPPPWPTSGAVQTCVTSLATLMNADAGGYPQTWADQLLNIYGAAPTISGNSQHPTNLGYKTIATTTAAAIMPRIGMVATPDEKRRLWALYLKLEAENAVRMARR